jgi:hypothetical protein
MAMSNSEQRVRYEREGNEVKKCFVCNNPGHMAKDCYKNKDAKALGSHVCFSCGEPGHISSVCEKKKTEYKRSQNRNEGTERMNHKSKKAVVEED